MGFALAYLTMFFFRPVMQIDAGDGADKPGSEVI